MSLHFNSKSSIECEAGQMPNSYSTHGKSINFTSIFSAISLCLSFCFNSLHSKVCRLPFFLPGYSIKEWIASLNPHSTSFLNLAEDWLMKSHGRLRFHQGNLMSVILPMWQSWTKIICFTQHSKMTEQSTQGGTLEVRLVVLRPQVVRKGTNCRLKSTLWFHSSENYDVCQWPRDE